VNNLPVICPADDAFSVEPNATNEFFVTFQHSQAGTTFNVPQSATATTLHHHTETTEAGSKGL